MSRPLVLSRNGLRGYASARQNLTGEMLMKFIPGAWRVFAVRAKLRRRQTLLAKLDAIALLDSAADIAAKLRKSKSEEWTTEDVLRREG